jgi:hypothetical protein
VTVEEATLRTADRGRYDLAAAALGIAGVAAVAALLPGWAFAGTLLGAVATVMALATLVLPGRSKRWGVLALVLALGAVGWSARATVLGPEEPASVAPPSPAASIPPGSTIVTYQIATDGLSVTHLSFVDLVDGVPTMTDALGVPPPFEHQLVVPPGTDLDLTELSVTGMGGSSSRRTTCRITVDGRTVSTSSADSAYGLVTCAVPRVDVE